MPALFSSLDSPNAPRSDFRKARPLVQPVLEALEIAAEVGYKREWCAAYPSSPFLTLVTYILQLPSLLPPSRTLLFIYQGHGSERRIASRATGKS